MRVYIAGALRNKNALLYLKNMRAMIYAATDLIQDGFSPHCPCLDYHYILVDSDNVINEGDLMACSMAWLRQAEAVLVLPGWENSKGVKAELKEAKLLSIPIFFSIKDLKYHRRVSEYMSRR